MLVIIEHQDYNINIVEHIKKQKAGNVEIYILLFNLLSYSG